MELRQLRALQAAEAAHVFLSQEPTPVPLTKASPSFWQQVAALKALTEAASARGTEQIPGPRIARNSARNAAALHLRDHTLRGLRQVAKVIVQSDAGVAVSPGLHHLISVPETSNLEAILQAAYSTAEKLVPYESLFVARGLAPDFLSQLQAEITEVEALAEQARDARATQLLATQDIVHLLREIRGIIRCLTVEIRRLCTQHGSEGMVTYHTWQVMQRPRRASVAHAEAPALTLVQPAESVALVIRPSELHIAQRIEPCVEPAAGQLREVVPRLLSVTTYATAKMWSRASELVVPLVTSSSSDGPTGIIPQLLGARPQSNPLCLDPLGSLARLPGSS